MIKQNVAVFGLGSIGLGIACSALRGAHRVWGADPDPVQLAKFQNDGGEPEPPIKVADILDTVVVVVLTTEQAQKVMFGDNGIVPKMRKGAVVICCTTLSPTSARQMAEGCDAHGVLYLDAPISGEPLKSMNGQLTVMAAGAQAAFEAAQPVLASISADVFELGRDVGAGSAMKSVNQLLAGVHVAAMAEAMTFALTQGIAPQTFIDVISKSVGTSRVLEHRAPLVIKGDYGPYSAVSVWPKDLGIVLDMASAEGFEAPMTKAALTQFQAASEMGLGPQGDAAVVKVYAKQAGIALPNET